MLPTETAKNRIMIFGPKDDGTYVVEFRTAEGDALAISIPRNETAVIQALPGAHAVLRLFVRRCPPTATAALVSEPPILVTGLALTMTRALGILA